MSEERTIQMYDVVQINLDEFIPIHFRGCLGYVVDASNTNVKVRIYQPKTEGEWPEFTEIDLPNIGVTLVGIVPENQRPL